MTVSAGTIRYHKSEIISVTVDGDEFLIVNKKAAFCNIPRDRVTYSLKELQDLAAQPNTNIHCQKTGDGAHVSELIIEIDAADQI